MLTFQISEWIVRPTRCSAYSWIPKTLEHRTIQTSPPHCFFLFYTNIYENVMWQDTNQHKLKKRRVKGHQIKFQTYRLHGIKINKNIFIKSYRNEHAREWEWEFTETKNISWTPGKHDIRDPMQIWWPPPPPHEIDCTSVRRERTVASLKMIFPISEIGLTGSDWSLWG